MSRVVDFHTHVLPKIDDGSGSVKESLAMLRMEAEQGVRRVVATPHFYAHVDTPKAFLERRAVAVDRLCRAMEAFPSMPRLSVGAEVHYFPGMGDTDILSELAIDNGRYVLIEMPMTVWTDKMYRELERIHERFGLIPIVAHVDRYIGPLRTRGIPERLMELPVLVQANTSFFQKFSTRSMALRMLKRGQIHLLGSDCHNMKARPVNIKQTVDLIEEKLGKKAIAQINACERRILSERK
jgi:protein-tyrosine phosphatase